jgi:hypothetical protein
MMRSRIGDASARISCRDAGRRPSDFNGMDNECRRLPVK